MDTEPAMWTNWLLHSNVQLEEFNQTGAAEAEAIAVAATVGESKFSDKILFAHSPHLKLRFYRASQVDGYLRARSTATVTYGRFYR